MSENKEVKKVGFFTRAKNFVVALPKRIANAFKNMVAELKNYTVAVTVFLIVFGFCIWLVDTGVVALMVGFTGLRG